MGTATSKEPARSTLFSIGGRLLAGAGRGASELAAYIYLPEKPAPPPPPRPASTRTGAILNLLAMLKLCIFGTSAIASYLFWWAAEVAGAEFFTCFLVSSVGTLAGCWVGWKIHQRFFD